MKPLKITRVEVMRRGEEDDETLEIEFMTDDRKRFSIQYLQSFDEKGEYWPSKFETSYLDILEHISKSEAVLDCLTMFNPCEYDFRVSEMDFKTELRKLFGPDLAVCVPGENWDDPIRDRKEAEIRKKYGKQIDAQRELCERKNLPHFAPYNGECRYCNKNIYQKVSGESHIDGCPLCYMSYCD